MTSPEIKLAPAASINTVEALEGLVALGKLALAVALIGGIAYLGIKKMTSTTSKQ